MSMTYISSTWKKNKTILLVFFVSIIAFGFGCYIYKKSYDRSKATLQKLYIQKNENLRMLGEIERFDRNIVDYDRARQRGVIGVEPRLRWLEILKKDAEEIGIPIVDFTLEKTIPVQQFKDYLWRPDTQVFRTPLKIEFKIVHEGDFYRFFDRYFNEANGLFSVDACLIENKYGDMSTVYSSEKMRATCELSWYTLGDFLAVNKENEV